ncbi:MAG: EF-hand domain-containing protein [Planctomycetota bacterium]|jgi:Ca2+-binding EF-hand superfamily protein
MKTTIFLLLFAAATFAGDDPAAKARSTIEKLDTDGDKKISKQEFIGSDSIFERWDADKDGFVTEAELTAGLAAPKRKAKPQRETDRRRGGKADPARVRVQVEATLKRLDKNGDGKIGGDEIPTKGAAFWKRMDRNRDGAIDSVELTAAFEARGGGRDRGNNMGKRILKMDADKDGKVSQAEWKGPAEAFARFDGDNDGFLTKKEIDAGAKRMRRRGGWKNGPSEALFRRMDTDGDKRITKEEWKLNPELFARFDANGDGAISADEVMPADQRQPMRGGDGGGAFLRRFDKNGDGAIDAKEFPNERRFAAMDRDGDGVLTKDEIEQAFDKQDRERKMSFVERYDRDRDGKVTREEFTGPAKLFDKLDKNADGVIDESEGQSKKGRSKKR